MPEINPLTNNQIFLKKIAENTGSDYETGDVSEINPLTIDQIFLKEIAANTTGQSGDITELEEKVTANTEAIVAITNEYSSKNIANNDATTKMDSGVLFTVNANKSVTVQRQSPTTDPYSYIKLFDDKTLPAIPLILSGCPNVTGLTLYLYDKTTSTRYNQTGDEIEVTPVAGHTYSLVIEALNSADLDAVVTVYPMIRDARITDATYVPYSMTNRELTNAVNRGSVTVYGSTSMTYGQVLQNLMSLIDTSKLRAESYIDLLHSIYYVRDFTSRSPLNISFTNLSVGGITEIRLNSAPEIRQTVFNPMSVDNDISGNNLWNDGNIILYY